LLLTRFLSAHRLNANINHKHTFFGGSPQAAGYNGIFAALKAAKSPEITFLFLTKRSTLLG